VATGVDVETIQHILLPYMKVGEHFTITISKLSHILQIFYYSYIIILLLTAKL